MREIIFIVGATVVSWIAFAEWLSPGVFGQF